jgi:hypothetical protein
VSYCRFSSSFFECDVYVYADVSGGWTTHVAGNRRKNNLPDHIKAMFPKDWSKSDAVELYMAANEAEREWIRTQPHEVVMGKNSKGEDVPMYFLARSEFLSIESEESGQSYNDSSPGECADRLETLKNKGFRVPQHAIDALREEQSEMPA